MDENKIQVKKLFGRYHKKLIAEAVIKTLIYCLIAGFTASFITVCVSRLARFDGAFLALMIGLAFFVFPAIFLYLKKLRPSVKRVAERIDRLGLEERAVTMLELDGESSFMAVKQRENAKLMLKRTPARQLKIKIPFKYAAVLIITAAVSIYMMSLPPVKPVAANESAGNSDEELAIIEQMLADLRETIDNADVNEELKKDLNEMVDRLENSFNENDTVYDKIMKILETSREIQKRLEEALTQRSIGEALQQYDSTRELGEAIENGDAAEVDDAFESMRENVQQLAGQDKADELNRIASDIDNALEDAGSPEGALPDALRQLSGDIREAAGLAESGDNDGADQAAGEAFSEAAESISEALAEQGNISEMMERLEGIMDEAVEMIAESELQEMQASGEESGQEGSGEGNEGSGEGEEGNGEGNEGSGEGNGDGEEGNGEGNDGSSDGNGEGNGEGNDGNGRNGSNMPNDREERTGAGTGSEEDFDLEAAMTADNTTTSIDRYVRDSEPVIDGKTPYRKVFGEYYDDAKQQMINGALSDEMRSKVQRYFEIIQ